MSSIVDHSSALERRGRGHVLLFPIGYHGHFPLFVQLLYTFNSECPGLVVTIATPPTFSKQVTDRQSAGEFQNIELHVEEIPSEAPKEENDSQSLHPGLYYPETQALRKRLIAQKRTGSESGDLPTSIIADWIVFWCKDLADELGIPCYTLCPWHPLGTLVTLEFSEVFKAGANPKTQDDDDDDDVLLLSANPRKVQAPGLSFVRVRDMMPEPIAFPEYFARVEEETLKSSGIILNTAEELDAPCGAVSALKKRFGPSRVFSIGPSLQLPGFGSIYSSVSTDEVIPWLDSQREKSVLYVAFGTVDALPKELSLELAAGLEASGVPFVWAVRAGTESLPSLIPEGFEKRTAGRGLILTGWVPQVSVLQHAAVGAFLRHCGWSSTMEAVCSGVPLIAWPLGSEQFLIARYIHDVTKVGLTVASLKEKNNHRFDGITRREVELAIRKVFFEDEGHQIRTNVNKMRRLATTAVQKGGSSYENLHRLLSQI